ncbi:MAG: Qat anti-phage system QueC-like protein QatC [Candidatus Acidiferrales bacterium]
MKRHLIVGRFGPGDREDVLTATGEFASRLNLVAQKKHLAHGIGDALDDLLKLGIFPTESGLDVLVLAAHVQAADTKISRASESQDGWTREIRIVVPVSDLSLWNPVVTLLQRMLNFLTGDRWIIGFRKRPKGFERMIPDKPPQSPKPPFDILALFSGGLDSLMSAIDSLERGETPLFVSHAGDGATSDAQNKLFKSLRIAYKSRNFERLRIWMDFRGWKIRGVEPEKTTRGRSFLFMATGIFVGSAWRETFALTVPENGLIALNVPLDPLRLGAFSTRTTHPYYMARWNDLLKALHIPGTVDNPYWHKTKGEMAAECANTTLLKKLVPDSMSCASPTKGRWLGLGTQHCGYCLPCLIRRAALLGSDKTTYSLSGLTQHELDTRSAEGQQVRSFQFAVARILRRPDLAKILIHKPGPLTDQTEDQQRSLAGVYSRGLAEVAKLLKDVTTAPS